MNQARIIVAVRPRDSAVAPSDSQRTRRPAHREKAPLTTVRAAFVSMTFVAALFAVAALVASANPLVARGENWAEWRGPQRNGVSAEAKAPETWTADRGVRWKTPLPGAGIASPIVWNDAVFVTTAEGAKQSELHVLCCDRDSGKVRWDRRLWGTAPTLYHAAKSGMASPTPVTDGQFVYAFFGTGDVFCLDFAGRLQWQRSLADEYGPFENRFGHTSSPLLSGDLLVLQCDHYGASYLLAIDKRTGADRWKVDRPGVWHSWSSPQRVNANGNVELVVCSSEAVDAFDVRNGEKLWTVRGMQRECIPTPVVGHGLVYAVSGPNGKTFAIQPGSRGDVTDSHVNWSSTRGGPFVPSPILVGDLLYMIDDQGIATCLDAHSGKRVWQKRLPGEYTASPVATSDKIYFCSDAGETTVLRAGTRQFEQLARNSLGEPIYSSPALSHGRLFVRTAQHLVCIE